MAKKGMARPEWTHPQQRNDAPPVPEIQGKAKHGGERAKPADGTGEAPRKTSRRPDENRSGGKESG